jgi:hypothetical protein
MYAFVVKQKEYRHIYPQSYDQFMEMSNYKNTDIFKEVKEKQDAVNAEYKQRRLQYQLEKDAYNAQEGIQPPKSRKRPTPEKVEEVDDNENSPKRSKPTDELRAEGENLKKAAGRFIDAVMRLK